jgi:hypothetical protein
LIFGLFPGRLFKNLITGKQSRKNPLISGFYSVFPVKPASFIPQIYRLAGLFRPAFPAAFRPEFFQEVLPYGPAAVPGPEKPP